MAKTLSEDSIEQYRQTNSNLNRRCQQAEAALADARRCLMAATNDKPWCSGSLGRAFLAYENSLQARAIEELTQELSEERERAERWKAEAMAWREHRRLHDLRSATAKGSPEEWEAYKEPRQRAWNALLDARALNDQSPPPSTHTETKQP